jgi:hypothetical protein
VASCSCEFMEEAEKHVVRDDKVSKLNGFYRKQCVHQLCLRADNGRSLNYHLTMTQVEIIS